ncbi:MAG: Rrf2 family transcriptional regulator [Proteobacteria bacterium]|jgi:Rrf2 family transcriptional regulator, cysteine metabolism repressor|nr:Rrf2 family transcriptional regulator [Pseudomonadota bacterium]
MAHKMQLNTKVRYGLRALLEIATRQGNGPVPLSAIAESQQVSQKYLEHIIGKLRKGGLVSSSRGLKGGYLLVNEPKDVTLLDVITALGDDCSMAECCINPTACARSDTCPTRPVWIMLGDRLREFWQGFTLEDLLSTPGYSEEHLQ